MTNYNCDCDFMDEDDDDDDNNVFRDVIKAMMFSFGDVKEPLKKSVDIVYNILRKEMNVLLMEAERVAHYRKSSEISHEEILFLMRKNQGKVKRLIKYLQVMDDSPGFGKSSALSFRNVLLENSNQTPKKKRAEKCKEFLASIEDFGEFTSILNDHTIIDVAHRNMLLRRNSMTEWMDLNEYKEFTEKILEKSFCSKQMFNDFEKWLLEDNLINMNLTTLAFEIVRFLARETVSKIIDLALIIKSNKNKKFKSGEISLKPFDFYGIAKECNFVELFPPLSIRDRNARNTDHSYYANSDSKESSIVHMRSLRASTNTPWTSKGLVESKAPKKDGVSLVTSSKKINGVDKLCNSSNIPVTSKDSAAPKVITLTLVPSVIHLKNVGKVDNLHASETHEDLDGQSKPDLESVGEIADRDNNSDSDSITQPSTVSTDEEMPMDECDSENQYFFVEDDSDSRSKPGDRNSDGSSDTDIPTSFLKRYVSRNPSLPRENIDNFIIDSLSDDEKPEKDLNTRHSSDDTTVDTSVLNKRTPDVTPSDSRYSSNDRSEDVMKEYHQKPSENGPYLQTPITSDEIVQAVALYHQHSWSNYFQSREKKCKTKLLCKDEYTAFKI